MENHSIYFLAAEATPFVKVGGLGDVAGSLPWALRSLNEDLDVRLTIPLHTVINRQDFELRLLCKLDMHTEQGSIPVEVFVTDRRGVPVYLIDGPPIRAVSSIYSADPSYDVFKYMFFSLAALELLKQIAWSPKVIHANDWHTAIAVYAVGVHRKVDPFFRRIATLLTIHNLPYLGESASNVMRIFGLPLLEDSSLPSWARDRPLPLGLLMADHIVAVSPSYARDILTPEFGSGLSEFLSSRQGALSGILNGLDVDYWNPIIDPYITVNYDVDTLEKRKENKIKLQSDCHIDVQEDIPLLAMVSRFDFQKGVDLAVEALRLINEQSWQMIFLGKGDSTLERAVAQLQDDFPQRVRAFFEYNEPLSHRIYSGADMILVPSRYEPCGLVQMIAMRYGCVPIARATGGLKDTIIDCSHHKDGTGFLFDIANPSSLAEAIVRALQTYSDRASWQSIQKRGMQRDFSWKVSARQYLDLYRKLSKVHCDIDAHEKRS